MKRFGEFSASVLATAYLLLTLYVHYDAVVFDGRPGMAPSSLLGVVVDVCVMTLLSIVGGRMWRKTGAIVLAVLFWALCIAHVVYFRAFGGYFDIALVRETQNLDGLGDSILSLFRWRDVIVTLVFFVLYVLGHRQRLREGGQRLWLSLSLAAISLTAFMLRPAVMLYGNGFNVAKVVDDVSMSLSMEKEKYGLLCMACNDALHINPKREATDNEKRTFASYMRKEHFTAGEPPRNVVLIIAESLQLDALQRVCEGDTVMPNLHKLTSVNGMGGVIPCVSMTQKGNSSDGQFIMMTGLLPHDAKITVNAFTDNRQKGLGTLMRERGMKTMMVIPTNAGFWRQDAMCRAYGIDSIVTVREGAVEGEAAKQGWGNDEQIFRRSAEIVAGMRGKPFFLTILTISSHMPYDKPMDGYSKSFHDKTFDAQYLNYLQKINYMDKWLGYFTDALKRCDQWKNTLVILAADHKVPMIDLKKNGVSEHIPLVLLNAGVDIENRAIGNNAKVIGQQDIYPTILDIMHFHQRWRGIGYSCFDKTEKGRMNTEQQQKASNAMLETDFFENYYKE